MRDNLLLARSYGVCDPSKQISFDTMVTKLVDQRRVANLAEALTKMRLNEFLGSSTVQMVAWGTDRGIKRSRSSAPA